MSAIVDYLITKSQVQTNSTQEKELIGNRKTHAAGNDLPKRKRYLNNEKVFRISKTQPPRNRNRLKFKTKKQVHQDTHPTKKQATTNEVKLPLKFTYIVVSKKLNESQMAEIYLITIRTRHPWLWPGGRPLADRQPDGFLPTGNSLFLPQNPGSVFPKDPLLLAF